MGLIQQTSSGRLIIPTPKQQVFLNSAEDDVFFGGSAGPGKSVALLLFSIMRRRSLAGTNGLILRRTFPELKMSLIQESKKILTGTARYNEQDHCWTFPGGGVLQFGYVDNDNDLDRYDSTEWADVCFDELTTFTEYQFIYLFSRQRGPRGIKRLARSASNPHRRGHTWVKKRYVTPSLKAPYQPFKNGDLTLKYIPGTLDDNPHIDKEEYERKLKALPSHLYKALRNGDWDATAGVMFEEFDRSIHVCKPFAIPSWGRRWVMNDPGYSDPFAWYWGYADEDGTVYVYREFARQADEEKLTYSDQGGCAYELSYPGTEIGEEPAEGAEHEKIDFAVTGMDAFTKHPETGKSIEHYYREGGNPWGFLKPIHGGGSKKLRAATLHEYLSPYLDENTGQMTARLKIFDTCDLLIQSMSALEADKNEPEQVAPSPMDHYYDALTYGLCAWHAEQSTAPKPPKTQQQLHKEQLARKNSRSRRKVS